MARKQSAYFDDFSKMIGFGVQASTLLQEVLHDFHLEKIGEYRSQMHAIENTGDACLHESMERLIKEFVTPIDREDIINLLHILDDLIDLLEDVLIRMYMYDIRQSTPAAVAMSDVIVRGVNALERALKEFPNYKKSTELSKYFIAIHDLEDEGDLLYINAVHELYKNNDDPKLISGWSRIYDKLENCCDKCEEIAELLESVAMQNA